MKLKSIPLTVFAFLTGLFSLQAQSLSPTVTPTQGGYASGVNVSLSWTMGETYTPTLIADTVMLSQGFEQPEVDIVTGAIAGSPFCTGSTINIPFTADGYVDSANIYTAELSDASGSFASPIVLGTDTSIAVSGTITGTVPFGTPAGSGYLVRVTGSAPAYTGKTTVVAITVITTVTPSVSAAITIGAQTICAGTPVTFTASPTNGGASPAYQWFKNGVHVGSNSNTYNNNALANGDEIFCVLTSNAACASPTTANSDTTTMTVNQYVSTSVTIDPSPDYIICSNSTLNFTATVVNGGASPTYQWQINSGSGYANVGTDSVNYSSNTPVNGNLVRCIVTPNSVCPSPASDTSNPTAMIVGTCNNIWVGNTTDWFDPTNWSANVVPTNCADGANLPPGLTNYPVLTGDASVGNVLIQGNANINLQNHNLSVCGNWTVTGLGTTIAGTGLVIFDGITNATQTISGVTNAGEIKIDNTGGGQVVMTNGIYPSKVNLYTALDLQQGNIDVTNGAMTFKSTTDSTIAILDNFSPGFAGTITGNITAERYYAASTYWWTDQHEMGSPIDNLPLSKFGANAATGGFVVPYSQCYEVVMTVGSPNGNVFSYHENSPNAPSCGMAQWYVEPSTGHALDGQGYSVALRGNGTLSVNGAPNLNSTYTLSNLSNSNWSNTTWEHHLLTSGWQLMSNPYLATLQINTSNPGLDNQVQVWQANGPFSGSYQTHMISEDAVIAPFQAFLVHVTNPGNGNTYTIKGTDRTRTPAVFYAQNANELDITAENLTTNLLDKTMVAFNSAATDSFDPQYDGYKMAGSLSRHTLYTQLSNGRWMSRNILNNVATTSTVPVGFEPGANANYNFSFGNLNTFDPTTYIMLEDKQLNIMYNVRNGDYQFSADSTDNWDRFVLHFTPPVVINKTDATCSSLGNISITQPGTANWNYTLTDNNNTVISSGTLNQSNSVYLNAAAGTYTLTLTDNNNYTVTKVIQVNGAQPVTAAFAPSATEVTVQNQVSFTNNSQNANTFSWNFGDGSASNLINPVHTYVTPGTYTVMMTAMSAGGCSSSVDQLVTVDAGATGIRPITENGISMWSNKNKVYVDFSDAGSDVNATIKIYNVLGQELSEEKYTLNGLYQKEIDDIDAAYVIVSAKNNDKIVTKKLFITNIVK